MPLDEKQLVIRDLSSSVQAAIEQRFLDQPSRGRSSPKQSWVRALIYIGALDTEASILALTLSRRALQIAEERGDPWIREINALRTKYEKELVEFAESSQLYSQAKIRRVDLCNRLSNVLYYAVQIYTQDGNIEAFNWHCKEACQKAGIPLLVAYKAAREKFESRGRRAVLHLPKDREDEENRMQRVIDENSEFLENV